MRLFATVLMLMLPATLAGQETRGTILGRVVDSTGAVIAGAEVKALHAETGVPVVARSNAAGNYVLPYLLTGTYKIQCETAGFKKFVREAVQVRINDTVELNIEMQVGDASESIQVTSETPLDRKSVV